MSTYLISNTSHVTVYGCHNGYPRNLGIVFGYSTMTFHFEVANIIFCDLAGEMNREGLKVLMASSLTWACGRQAAWKLHCTFTRLLLM